MEDKHNKHKNLIRLLDQVFKNHEEDTGLLIQMVVVSRSEIRNTKEISIKYNDPVVKWKE